MPYFRHYAIVVAFAFDYFHYLAIDDTLFITLSLSHYAMPPLMPISLRHAAPFRFLRYASRRQPPHTPFRHAITLAG